MAGAAVAGELSHARSESRSALGQRVRFEIATPAHDAAIRHLLRETPMPGEISISLEHEPSHFAAMSIAGPEHTTIVALEGDRVVAAGSVSARMRFINGQPMRVGYLSDLRLHPSCHGRAWIIRMGYAWFHSEHQRNGPPLYLTSIVAGNLRARRFLERGWDGMPTYRPLGDFVTMVIRAARTSTRFRDASRSTALRDVSRPSPDEATVDLLNRSNQRYQLAPVWTADDLHSPGLSPQDFHVIHASDGAPLACAALWDQRSFKQAVVRGYSKPLRELRPLINAFARLVGQPRLPDVGNVLPSAFVSHVACDPDQPKRLRQLIRELSVDARARRIEYLCIGFDARDPRLDLLRKWFSPRVYRSKLYAVHWDDGADLARSLDDRLLAPEVALL